MYEDYVVIVVEQLMVMISMIVQFVMNHHNLCNRMLRSLITIFSDECKLDQALNILTFVSGHFVFGDCDTTGSML